MKFKSIISLIIIGLAACFTQVAFAASINIDFGDDFLGLPSSYGAASSQTGHWNEITSNLLDTAGLITEANLNLSANNSSGNYGTPTNNDTILLSDNFFSSNGNSWSVILSGIDEGLYNIFYYAPAHLSVSTGLFSINSTNVSSLTGSTSLIQGISWDVLDDVSIDNSGLLIIQSEDNNDYRGLSGLQIVPVATVPIPHAVWLFGSGIVCFLGLRKRKSNISREMANHAVHQV